MKLISFLEQESSSSFKTTLFMATIAGISENILLATVNHGADYVYSGAAITWHLLIYIITFALFLYSIRYAISNTVVAIEDAISNSRGRLIKKLRNVDLTWLEERGHGHVYTRLTKDTAIISQAAPILAFASISIVVITFVCFYIALISPISLAIGAVVAAGFYALYLPRSKRVKARLEEVGKQDARYYDVLEQLLNGFKELKINRTKGDDVQRRIAATSDTTRDLKMEVGLEEAESWSIGRLSMYALLPILTFIVPLFYYEHSEDVYKITATLLFLGAPAASLLNLMPMLHRIDVVIDDLYELENEIDQATRAWEAESGTNRFRFETIRLGDICYSYRDQSGDVKFSVGPINETISTGELLFIIGGNGSGKSTLLKLIVGLYFPERGGIYIDERELQPSDYPAFREMFSIIFTDFHLFDRLYGLRDLDASKVTYWLERMQIQHKTAYRDGRFTNFGLSTGQRKRLAFIAAMLEDKPVLILDEFAADQDPQFRDFFYDTLLPELKAAGKTVIAVTHDDRYFHLADRVLKLDLGQVVPA